MGCLFTSLEDTKLSPLSLIWLVYRNDRFIAPSSPDYPCLALLAGIPGQAPSLPAFVPCTAQVRFVRPVRVGHAVIGSLPRRELHPYDCRVIMDISPCSCYSYGWRETNRTQELILRFSAKVADRASDGVTE